jgi:hypothetical protein
VGGPDETGAQQSSHAAGTDDEAAARIHAQMVRANQLFKQKRYREARKAARRLAELDPDAFMPEQIIEACNRELGRRRSIFLALIVGLGVVAGTLVVLHHYLVGLRLSCTPKAGTVRLAEGESRQFAVRSALGRHRDLEYQWSLLGADAQPVRGPERSALQPDPNAPWTASYSPAYSIASSHPGGSTARRTVIVRAADASGRTVETFRWTLEVSNVARPPAILGTQPVSRVPVTLEPGQTLDFQIEAVDGDGGAEVAYQWFLDDRLQTEADGPTWTYEAPPKLDSPAAVLRVVSCRVSNRYGEPLAQNAEWRVVVAPPKPTDDE